MTTQLTEGFITALWQGKQIQNPIIQVLNYQHHKLKRPLSSDCYQLIVWDGTLTTKSAVLAVRLNNLISKGILQTNSVIRLKRYACKEYPCGKKVLVIFKLKILIDGNFLGKKISNLVVDDALMKATVIGHRKKVRNPEKKINIVPINRLHQFDYMWYIKARLLQKGCIYSSSDNRNVFTMDLIDASGAIKATAIENACDKLHDLMERNKIFLISKFSVIPAARSFTTIPHDFEIILTERSVVVQCDNEDGSIPKIYFSFTVLSELQNIPDRGFVDIIGICISVSDLQTKKVDVKSKKTETKQREITLVDTSNATCSVILCDNLAQNFNISKNVVPVVSITGVGMIEIRGSKTGVACEESHLQLDPDLPQAHDLRRWYDSLDSDHIFSNILGLHLTKNCMKPKLEDYSNNEGKDGQELETIEFRVEENSFDVDTSSTLFNKEKTP